MEDATESLTQEVQRSIDFFSATSSDEKVQKVFITGGVSKVPSVRTSLENRLGVEVNVIDPWRRLPSMKKILTLNTCRPWARFILSLPAWL